MRSIAGEPTTPQTHLTRPAAGAERSAAPPLRKNRLVPSTRFYNAGRRNFRKVAALTPNRRYVPAALLALCATLLAGSSLLHAKEKESEHESAKSSSSEDKDQDKDKHNLRHLADESQVTQNSITVAGRKVVYQAEAGVLVVHQKDPLDDDPPPPGDHDGSPPARLPEATMSYVAYFQGDHENPQRPITFLFNGGPGSSSVWLHMGAFGPKRVLTKDDSHSPAAPYKLVDNEYSLSGRQRPGVRRCPGYRFSHLRGTDKEKAFYGVDEDAHAFANFIVEFLSRHGRWNSPKYLFGESYGTTRAAVLAYVLQTEKDLDLNGIILLSAFLAMDDSADGPQFNPGVDQPYVPCATQPTPPRRGTTTSCRTTAGTRAPSSPKWNSSRSATTGRHSRRARN